MITPPPKFDGIEMIVTCNCREFRRMWRRIGHDPECPVPAFDEREWGGDNNDLCYGCGHRRDKHESGRRLIRRGWKAGCKDGCQCRTFT